MDTKKKVYMKRKTIQIAVVPENEIGDKTLYALCSDGSLWHGIWFNDEVRWREIGAPFTNEGDDNAASCGGKE